MTKRQAHRMPADVRHAIEDGGVLRDYCARPHYQRNDYLGWIGGAKQDRTRSRRIDRMVDELKRGGIYMGMKHAPSAKG